MTSPDSAFRQRFSRLLLGWFAEHGRHDLPWQHPRDAYRVWVSEIMLQQTQVATVIPYFERFLVSFPNVAGLANASQDEVLSHWSGLGYYARARNLHAAAQRLVSEYGGVFPQAREELESLPGIGRSTAAAICAQAFGQCEAILDGNVKRVLARVFAIKDWPGKPAVQKEMWAIAEALTPQAEVVDYTQAIMDLGATLCRRSRPSCLICPLQPICKASALGIQGDLPARKPKKDKPVRHQLFLLIRDEQNRILLQRRPPSGLWGGLWCLPSADNIDQARQLCRSLTGREPTIDKAGNGFRHSFSHFHLDIQPHHVRLGDTHGSIKESDPLHWHELNAEPPGGLAAPVSRLLEMAANDAISDG